MTISKIIFDLNDALSGLDVGGIYDQTAPKNLDKNIKSFIVIDVSSVSPAYDTIKGESNKAIAFINIFAKDKANGIKNTALIDDLTEKAIDAMEESDIIGSLSSIGSMPIKYENFHGTNIIYSILKK